MFFLQRLSSVQTPMLYEHLGIVNVGESENDEWYSIYLKGEKIGYSNKSIRDAIGTKRLVVENTYFRLPVGGVIQEVVAQSITTIDTDFAVSSFSFQLQSGKYVTSLEGRIEDGYIKATVVTREFSESLTVPIEGKIFPSSMIPQIITSQGNLKQGQNFSIPTFDPFTMSKGYYSVGVTKKIKRHLKGKERELWVLSVEWKGLYSEMWVSDSGELMYERAPGGFEQYRESAKQALEFALGDESKNDILTSFGVRSVWNFALSPRDARYLKIIAKGLNQPFLELGDFNQRVIDDTIIEICSGGFDIISLPDSSDTMETPFIQCNDNRIKKSARKIIGNTTDTLQMLLRINDWLYKNIEKDYQSSIPSAIDVLSKLRGDCNEHSILFTALARSLSIPTRINVGLVFREDGFFLYHAWVQSYVDGRWLTFDPTFGQHPADATHIKLVSGDIERQVELLRIGEVSIKILEAKNRCNPVN